MVLMYIYLYAYELMYGPTWLKKNFVLWNVIQIALKKKKRVNFAKLLSPRIKSCLSYQFPTFFVLPRCSRFCSMQSFFVNLFNRRYETLIEKTEHDKIKIRERERERQKNCKTNRWEVEETNRRRRRWSGVTMLKLII